MLCFGRQIFFHLKKWCRGCRKIFLCSPKYDEIPSYSPHSRMIIWCVCKYWILAAFFFFLNISFLKNPFLRLILFYFHFYSHVFFPDFLPPCFAHSWSIYFCHFNSSSWSYTIISEFYGSVHRYSGGVLLILLHHVAILPRLWDDI